MDGMPDAASFQQRPDPPPDAQRFPVAGGGINDEVEHGGHRVHPFHEVNVLWG